MTMRVPKIRIHMHHISLVQDPDRVSSAHRGDLIHLALSFLDHFSGIEDIERAVLQAFSLQGRDRGRWKIDKDYVKPIFRALSLRQVRPWFENGVVNLREVEVVDARGELHRIDRVVIGEEALDVIDFKVGRQEEDHPAQVTLYKGFVKDMFRRPTRGYLLYIDEPSVVSVP
ncbi:MAG: hypothetical protein KAJ09_07405 [Deltaproteobacteria bacterium]|nr:hypothetical protein [Deltaproteobacteria bacterium]